jgi:hypothetical protein
MHKQSFMEKAMLKPADRIEVLDHSYVLKENIRQRLLNNCTKLICYQCGRPVRVEEQVVSRPSENGGNLFHKNCFKRY